MTDRMWCLLSVVAGLLSCASSAVAIEPWADTKLAVTTGLELWLDARRALGDQTLPTTGSLAVWRDASGKQQDLRQDNADAQPTVIAVGESAVVRFDGVDDHLRNVGSGPDLSPFTVFVVAAPRHNLGLFRALLAFNAADQRDYQSGMTVDMGPAATPRFSILNIEGRGFGGALNLRTRENAFGQLHIMEITSDGQQATIRLAVDGQTEGERPRANEPLSMAEITVGARYYNNGAGPQHVDGFGRGDIAEVLVYNRALTAEEIGSVRAYLNVKYEALRNSLPPDSDSGAEPLVTVQNPPPIQMFLPGFTVRELPVELTNINNVKYREDGTLVALGYDGRVWLLRDTNEDGLEDQAQLFWENKDGLRATIGMDLTPPGYKLGEGVLITGKTRCLLLVDADRDGRADKEIEVAGGWKEGFVNVDGLGAAFDRRDGSVYFGRGTYNFTDPLLRDKDGVPHYSMTDESGAIIRVAPDFKSREIVATGIRFPVAIRFNRHGDLFVTDQEGATWVPNGNPLDELLHIQAGRHYGFPARHPTHLPGVIDEPSTFDYGPQHQSTCGLNFNEPVLAGGPVFGPVAWAGDALVAGESRGKLYRTQLVKSAMGYVARTHLLGNVSMLTVDACVSPAGELVVTCHSGGPDWGTGPTGKGKLFKIAYADREHPQPVFAWPVGPREVRIEFDRPLDPQALQDAARQTKLTSGVAVRAGDRFESFWPGYAVVQAQKLAPRFDVPIHSLQLTPDRRTLLLSTDPTAEALHYALTLPGMGRPTGEITENGVLPQHAAIDLDFDLSGCEVIWSSTDGSQTWTGWLPHLDLQVSRELTAGSSSHAALWAAIEQPGELILRTQLDLRDMLHPAVQPGSQLDFEYPSETVTVNITSPMSVDLEASGPNFKSNASGQSVSFTHAPGNEEYVAVELRLKNAGGPLALVPSWTTNEDQRPRPFPLRRLLVPWAKKSSGTRDTSELPPAPELAGGSWARGRREFFGEQAACAKCHTIHGQGATIGPDLSNLIHRDYASVARDVTLPSFAINPDHLSYAVVLGDGRTLTGVVQTLGDRVRVGDTKGVITEVSRSDIEELKPLPTSTMPEGIPKLIGPDRLRDLLTFLLTPPPQMPRDLAGPRPKPRTVAEVQAVLAGAPEPPAPIRPLRVVLVAGPKDHGPGEHDYPAWQKAWAELLSVADQLEVATAWEWPAKDEFQKADVMVFYQHGDWNTDRAEDVDAFLDRGGGLVYIHWAVDGRQFGRDFAERIGLAALGGVGFRHGELTLNFQRETEHPIIRNFDSLTLTDETYWKMVGPLAKDRILGTAIEEGTAQPQLWTFEPRRGRVFVSIPGHYSWTFDDPLFRVLLLRGIAWTAREPVDRFNELVWPGAAIAK